MASEKVFNNFNTGRTGSGDASLSKITVGNAGRNTRRNFSQYPGSRGLFLLFSLRRGEEK
jgi:hypothetical protein